jgi:hypothetical protein
MDLAKRRLRFGSAAKTTLLLSACVIAVLGFGINYAQQRAFAVATPPAATLSFQYTSWTVNATDGTAEIGVTLTGTPTGTVSIEYATTTGGTAKPHKDYLPVDGSLTWSPTDGGTTKTFTIKVFNRRNLDTTRTVNLTLSDSTNASLTGSTSVLNIVDTHVMHCDVR